ncbi:hypothetical protein ACFOGI_13515 [Virgibacillus xinjiangensis]|uniref:DUF1145 domain-containing protein n=1 Tax=Virgibacillus xinjiangensis TaxID=393090 RepID=A0ABV7CY07_9BACI
MKLSEGIIINIKLLAVQLAVIAIVWSGMAFFYKEMSNMNQFIFHLVTSWMLFLIVMIVKGLIKERKHRRQ